jgi:ABC-2 type transport system permease protein
MKTIWIIAKHSLKLLARDKTAAIWMVLMPLVYIFFFGSTFRQSGDPAKSKASLAIDNRDTGYLSRRLLSALRSENLQIDSLMTLPEQTPVRLLTIPENFTDNLLRGYKVTLSLSSKEDANVQAGMTANVAIRKAYFRLLADLAEVNVAGHSFKESDFSIIDGRAPLVHIDVEMAGRHKIIPSGFNQQVPANIVMFAMLIVFIYAGSALLEERNAGLLRRIKIAPVGFLRLYLGKLLGATMIGLVQILILLVAGRLIFGVYYGSSPGALSLLVILFAVAVGSLGLCLGFLIKDEEKMLGVGITLGLVLSALSGCWFPLEVCPAWMNQLANFLPSGLALKAFHRLISYGYGFREVWPYLLGLLGISGLFFLIFARLLRQQE